MVRRIVTMALVTLSPLAAGAAVVKDDFYVRNAQDLVDLCSTPESDPLNDAAIHFCHGFVSGAWQYHQAQANGPDGERIVCPPDPPPTRDQAVAMFIDWSRANPERMSEPAVEALFRFLAGKYPCKQAPSAAKGSSK
jgi:hypothetical protein